jgi:hypothetical protein
MGGFDLTTNGNFNMAWTYTVDSSGNEYLETDGYYMSITDGNANTVRLASPAATWERLSITVKSNDSPRMCIYGTYNQMYVSLYWKSLNTYDMKRASSCGPWEAYLFYENTF